MYKTFKIFEALTSLLQVIAWPMVVLIIFLVLKTPIKNFIARIRKIGYGDAGVTVSDIPVNQTDVKDSPIEKLSKGQQNEAVDKILKSFASETIELFNKAVKEESRLDKFNDPKEREEILFSYSTVIYLIMHFNKIYNIIYGSQLRILQRLNSSVFESRDTLKTFYDEVKNIYPRIYENYPYENYLNYLLGNYLIIEEGKSIKITILGKDFLKYIIESSLSFERAF